MTFGRDRLLPTLLRTPAVCIAIANFEESMSDFVVRTRAVYRLVPSTSFKVVCLFSLLGLAVSAVLLALIAPDRLAWILSHIE